MGERTPNQSHSTTTPPLPIPSHPRSSSRSARDRRSAYLDQFVASNDAESSIARQLDFITPWDAALEADLLAAGANPGRPAPPLGRPASPRRGRSPARGSGSPFAARSLAPAGGIGKKQFRGGVVHPIVGELSPMKGKSPMPPTPTPKEEAMSPPMEVFRAEEYHMVEGSESLSKEGSDRSPSHNGKDAYENAPLYKVFGSRGKDGCAKVLYEKAMRGKIKASESHDSSPSQGRHRRAPPPPANPPSESSEDANREFAEAFFRMEKRLDKVESRQAEQHLELEEYKDRLNLVRKGLVAKTKRHYKLTGFMDYYDAPSP